MASMPARRLAVVTGANKGIGFHVAQQLVAAGMRVVVACRDEGRGRQAAVSLGAEFEVLDIASDGSIVSFAQNLISKYGHLDILVNNAAIAFKGSDPTPFAAQTEPTLHVNFFATMRLTDQLLPLLRASGAAGRQPRIVNVASMAGHLSKLRPDLQQHFASPALTRQELVALVQKFAIDVQAGRHREEGWGNSNYGMSKLALIAYTRVVAREEGMTMRVNACCPGYCKTDMSSNQGGQPPEIGARTPALLAMLPDGAPSGEFWQVERQSRW